MPIIDVNVLEMTHSRSMTIMGGVEVSQFTHTNHIAKL